MSKIITNAIAKLLNSELRSRGLSQGQLAARAGCTQPAISALITGKSKRPSIELLVGVADALDLPIDRLLGRDRAQNPMPLEKRVEALERRLGERTHQRKLAAKKTAAFYADTLLKNKGDLLKKGVEHIAIFGSAARGQLTDESDIDVSVGFSRQANIGVFELVDLQQYLEKLFGRNVDIVERSAIRPSIRRRIEDESVDAF